MAIVAVVRTVGVFNGPGIVVRQTARVPSYWTTAIALLSAVMTGAVAYGGTSRRGRCPSRRRTDGGTVVADLYAARGSDAVVLAHGAVFDKASWTPLASWLASRGH